MAFALEEAMVDPTRRTDVDLLLEESRVDLLLEESEPDRRAAPGVAPCRADIGVKRRTGRADKGLSIMGWQTSWRRLIADSPGRT
jgi:hypothetical protein